MYISGELEIQAYRRNGQYNSQLSSIWSWRGDLDKLNRAKLPKPTVVKTCHATWQTKPLSQR